MATLTPEARALLETIAGPESSGRYNVIYGGSLFDDYRDHPRQYVTIQSGPNKGQKSSAAGKYQFLGSTWDDISGRYGLEDFSPANQDAAAWYLASEEYKRDTGRDLQQDLAAGDISRVPSSLRNQWTSLPGGIEQGITGSAFAEAYANALGSAPQMAYNAGLPNVGPTGGPALDAINRAAGFPTSPGMRPQTAVMQAPKSAGGSFWGAPLSFVKNATGGMTAPVMTAANNPNVQRAAVSNMLGSLDGRTAIMRTLMNRNIGDPGQVTPGHTGPGTRAIAVNSQGSSPVTVMSAGNRSGSLSDGTNPSGMNMDVYRTNASVLGGGNFNTNAIQSALSSGKTLLKLA